MKRLLSTFLLIGVVPMSAKPLVEVKAGYFFFTDSAMNNVYNKGGLDLQLAGSYPIWHCLHVYGSIEGLFKYGYSSGFSQKTNLWAVPLSLGLRAQTQVNSHIDYYASIGPRYFFVGVHNDSPYVDKNMRANGCGGFINSGFLWKWHQGWFLDFFGEYSYGKVSFHSSFANTQSARVQVGGFTFGGGLGYTF